MTSHSCLVKNPLPWLAVLGIFLAFGYSSKWVFLTIFLTSLPILFYTVTILCSKSSQQKWAKREESPSCQFEDAIKEISEKKEDLVSSSEIVSDSESFDHPTSSDGSENEWIFRENLSHSTQFSDGSISDEEGLIEIALPEGHTVDSSKRGEEEIPCHGFPQKWPDCSMESHFRQPNWMEMLMEEENLIEIDICMGSIKCSRFEIEA